MVRVHERTHPGHRLGRAGKPKVSESTDDNSMVWLCSPSDSSLDTMETNSKEAMLWHVLVPPATAAQRTPADLLT